MKNCVDIIPVYEFRPLLGGKDYHKLYRYAKGKWIEDDGKHGVAFARPDNCIAYGFQVPCRPNILWSWAKNGQWSAFVKGHPRGNAWHYMLRSGEENWGDCWQGDSHPNTKAFQEAMGFVSSRTGCANGRGPEFHINDPYIANGLLRIQSTKKVVRFPKIFNCMYCGEIDWRKAEKAK